MQTLSALQTPSATDCATRIEWAGERIADLAEGILTRETAVLIVSLITGWTDLCADDERRQYRELARMMQDMIEAA